MNGLSLYLTFFVFCWDSGRLLFFNIHKCIFQHRFSSRWYIPFLNVFSLPFITPLSQTSFDISTRSFVTMESVPSTPFFITRFVRKCPTYYFIKGPDSSKSNDVTQFSGSKDSSFKNSFTIGVHWKYFLFRVLKGLN